MKTEINYILFAENIVTDKSDKLTLVNIFEGVRVKEFPAIHKNIFAIASIRFASVVKDKELIFKTKIFSPEGKLMGENLIQRFVTPARKEFGVNLVIDAGPIQLQGPGKYEFQFLMNDKVIAQKQLDVALRKDIFND